MLDRASLERLSRTPEKNAPLLNVALAEEGPAAVLLALARSSAVGPEAIEVIVGRIAAEGADVGRDRQAGPDEAFVSPAPELDRLLVAHPRASGTARDAILGRHADDPFFVLAAAAHPRATLDAALRAVDWPPASPVHDRLWLALVDPSAVPPLTLEAWSQDPSPLRREAAARITREPALLEALAADPSRQVRRAVASNRFGPHIRARLASSDPAPEVRLRAGGALSAHGEPGGFEGGSYVDSARFAAALRAMRAGGVLAPDVTRALSAAGALDDQGALIAAQVLPRAELGGLVEQVVGAGLESSRSFHLAAGLALRAADDETEHTEIVYDTVKTLASTTTSESRLTGKARLAAWTAEGLARCGDAATEPILEELADSPLGAERMILARGAAIRGALVSDLCAAAAADPACAVPAALLELAWADPSIPDARVVELAARIPKAKKRAEDLPEDEIDLDPSLRSLEVLERVVLTATRSRNLSPRAALAVVALDARRVRYILSAMPQWKGRLSGGPLARVLRQHAGALEAAQAETRARVGRIEGWTERMLGEIELAIALAVGHLTGAEVARRIQIGRQVITDGLSLVAGAEARAAIEGPASLAALLAWATKTRTSHPAALATWLLLERLDRHRAPSLIASSLDALAAGGAGPAAASAKGVVAPSVCDALAVIERRTPGRLETIHPQSPRGRATLASAIARAYRALGGMRDERSG